MFLQSPGLAMGKAMQKMINRTGIVEAARGRVTNRLGLGIAMLLANILVS